MIRVTNAVVASTTLYDKEYENFFPYSQESRIWKATREHFGNQRSF